MEDIVFEDGFLELEHARHSERSADVRYRLGSKNLSSFPVAIPPPFDYDYIEEVFFALV